MRVIAGYLGGRNFDAPGRASTHPMSEKMRGAIFSVLGDIEGLSVLDVYSGSGALSIEAISRGADKAVAIEQDKAAVATIKSNLKLLDLNESKLKVVNARIESWLNTTEDKYDIILADPPYDATKVSVIIKLIDRLKDDGIFVLSWPASLELPEIAKLLKLKDYGDSQLAFFGLA